MKRNDKIVIEARCDEVWEYVGSRKVNKAIPRASSLTIWCWVVRENRESRPGLTATVLLRASSPGPTKPILSVRAYRNRSLSLLGWPFVGGVCAASR